MNKNLIIIGARGYEYEYGGWETFVKKFVDYSDGSINFYIPNMIQHKEHFKGDYVNDNVKVHDIYVRKCFIPSLNRFIIKAFRYYIKLIKKEKIENPTILVLGCEVGPFMGMFYKKLKKLGAKVVLNPGGLVWKSDKYSDRVKKYYKKSELQHIVNCDTVVCDSKAIKKYFDDEYSFLDKKTYFIPYGADRKVLPFKTDEVRELYDKYNITEGNYYLVIGRFVPENNYETILAEFMKSTTDKDLVIISNIKINDELFDKLKNKYHFENDKRIKFVGTLYDQKSVKYVREHAYAYIHGHSVGGTNPSLLEALNSTKINILYNVPYNSEVGGEACFYFTRKHGSLRKEIDKVDKLGLTEIKIREKLEKDIIKRNYTWDKIVSDYKKVI